MNSEANCIWNVRGGAHFWDKTIRSDRRLMKLCTEPFIDAIKKNCNFHHDRPRPTPTAHTTFKKNSHETTYFNLILKLLVPLTSLFLFSRRTIKNKIICPKESLSLMKNKKVMAIWVWGVAKLLWEEKLSKKTKVEKCANRKFPHRYFWC